MKVNAGKRYARLANIEGEMHDLEMIFHRDPPSKKKEATKTKPGRQNKKQSTYGKTKQEVAQMHIESYMEEKCPDWDSLYLEIVDQQSDSLAVLFDKRRLSEMLSEDEYFDWQSALTLIDPLFIEYITNSLKVDKTKGEMKLHNKANLEQNIIQKYSKTIGGRYLQRQDLAVNADEERIVHRILIANSEAEMCEFLYDIKIY